MTLDDALTLAAQKIDKAFAETVEKNFARMVEHGLSTDAIAEFQKTEADSFPTIRADALAKLRESLQLVCLQRGVETFQQRWNA
jgi:hypothetical protein